MRLAWLVIPLVTVTLGVGCCHGPAEEKPRVVDHGRFEVEGLYAVYATDPATGERTITRVWGSTQEAREIFDGRGFSDITVDEDWLDLRAVEPSAIAPSVR